jgi:hypothetical protein
MYSRIFWLVAQEALAELYVAVAASIEYFGMLHCTGGAVAEV